MPIELRDIRSGYNLAEINNNFKTIQRLWDEKLDRLNSRQGNQMSVDLDMNNFSVLNAKTTNEPTSLVNKEFVDNGLADVENKTKQYSDEAKKSAALAQAAIDIVNGLIGIGGEFPTDSVDGGLWYYRGAEFTEGLYIFFSSDVSVGSDGWTLVSGVGAQGIQGPQGPQGVVGPVGAIGPVGQRGATGPQGIQGPIGDIGPRGDKGDKGSVGATGVQGVVGPVGSIGPNGPQGVSGPIGPRGDKGGKGDSGDVGPQGPQGIQGLTGPVGPIGATGPVGNTGPKGVQGPQGLQGVTGKDGTSFKVDAIGTLAERAQYDNQPKGFSFYATDEEVSVGVFGAIFIKTSSTADWGNAIPFGKGPQGDIGPVGPEGVQGVIGVQGPTGSTGAKGPIGLQGPQGAVGPKGSSGETGATGIAGATGDRGPRGDVGPIGAKGETGGQGPVGIQGPEGLRGPTGQIGAKGDIGERGPVGVQGPVGETGARGPEGIQGPVGIKGPQGVQGAVGAQGPIGARGPTGSTGPTGSAGSKGSVGDKGKTGDVGISARVVDSKPITFDTSNLSGSKLQVTSDVVVVRVVRKLNEAGVYPETVVSISGLGNINCELNVNPKDGRFNFIRSFSASMRLDDVAYYTGVFYSLGESGEAYGTRASVIPIPEVFVTIPQGGHSFTKVSLDLGMELKAVSDYLYPLNRCTKVGLAAIVNAFVASDGIQ